MYLVHPTPYHNPIAGIIERARVFVVSNFAQIKPSDHVLEVGCESGGLLSRLPYCKRLVGLDISPRALEDARINVHRRVELVEHDAEKPFPFPKQSFDVVICSQLLEHVENPDKVVKNIIPVVKKGSRVVFSVPDEPFLETMKNFFKKLSLLQILFPGIEEKQSEWHLQAFTKQKMKNLIKKPLKTKKHARVFGVYHVFLCIKV